MQYYDASSTHKTLLGMYLVKNYNMIIDKMGEKL